MRCRKGRKGRDRVRFTITIPGCAINRARAPGTVKTRGLNGTAGCRGVEGKRDGWDRYRVKGGNVNRRFRRSYLRRRFEWVPVNGNRIVRHFLYAAHQADAVLCVCNNGHDSETRRIMPGNMK